VAYKAARIDREIGAVTMWIIWSVCFVQILGTILLISLAGFTKDGLTDKGAQRSEHRWAQLMLPFCLTIYALPVVNFYQFLRLASRLVKVKFHHCDDDITELCLSNAALGFEQTGRPRVKHVI
jgi:hypothetical protein